MSKKKNAKRVVVKGKKKGTEPMPCSAWVA